MILKIFIVYLLYNLYCFLLMAYDKWQSKREGWRVPEYVLLLHAIFFGSIGILVGIYSPLRHKRNHILFYLGVPLLMIIEFFILAYLFYISIAKIKELLF